MLGVLSGVKVVEFAAMGPAPFAAMMLADHGADVLMIQRPGAVVDPADPLLRSRRAISLDLKTQLDVAHCRQLCRDADAVIEGFRPGVMERLGLGPDVLLDDNPALVYGRMTGWGQEGALCATAGHDINYIAISGVLGMVGPVGQKPAVPLNLVGDFGGGGMLLAFAVVSAVLAARSGAPGQVIDCAMTDGSALLTAMMWRERANGNWSEARGTNLLDGGAPYYATYATSDGKAMAVGAIEPQFYAQLLDRMGLAGDADLLEQNDRALWPRQQAKLAEMFASRTRAEWTALFDGSDACVAPVLSLAEAAAHPHNRTRGTFVRNGPYEQPAPAPRFSATPPAPPSLPPKTAGAA